MQTSFPISATALQETTESKSQKGTMWLFALLLVAKASAKEPSTAGFISIDCGLDDVSSYTDKYNGLLYSSDANYIKTGKNRRVSIRTNLTGLHKYHATLRNFPDGVRNCYSMGPVQPGTKYRVKAEFFYGSYNILYTTPVFQIYIGVNLWQAVGLNRRAEIITVADSDRIEVCLINTYSGTPFISELDLRPLPFSLYGMVTNSSNSSVISSNRINYGVKFPISFPYDIYDRGWYPLQHDNIDEPGEKSISTNEIVNVEDNRRFPVPLPVLQTAIEAKSLLDSINITTSEIGPGIYILYMYFAELRKLGSNETREFSIYAGEELILGPFRPRFLVQDVVETPPRQDQDYFIRATASSTLPPIINAVEILSLQQMPQLPTVYNDVKAMLELKSLLLVTKNWQGDPCVPRKFIWEGLGCTFDDSMHSRIISLNLSQSGLSGIIPQAIINLTNLTSLDLSYNSFIGEIPEFLGNLAALQFLNLEGNNLNGSVPAIIYQRSRNRSLTLRINSNPNLCPTSEMCNATGWKNKKVIVRISVATSVAVLLFGAALLYALVIRRKKIHIFSCRKPGELNITLRQNGRASQFVAAAAAQQADNRLFTERDIISITNNFSQPIGKGSSGTVYLGELPKGAQVAVKVMLKTDHGGRQFEAEAELLSRVHHRYLISLLGYSYKTMALIYEYATQGSLAAHLSGDSANSNTLNWNVRLNIALETAEGLDYLHHGCRPPIVHRDLKTSNILLTENFRVKIADFGWSRSFASKENTYVSTVIVGTPGYLDPEYQETNKLSAKSDVYSFGVVLLVLVTGKPPITRGRNLTHIADEVREEMERGDAAGIADPRMRGIFNVRTVTQVIDIAFSCASQNSNQRPTMSQVVARLRECLSVDLSQDLSYSSLAMA